MQCIPMFGQLCASRLRPRVVARCRIRTRTDQANTVPHNNKSFHPTKSKKINWDPKTSSQEVSEVKQPLLNASQKVTVRESRPADKSRKAFFMRHREALAASKRAQRGNTKTSPSSKNVGKNHDLTQKSSVEAPLLKNIIADVEAAKTSCDSSRNVTPDKGDSVNKTPRRKSLKQEKEPTKESCYSSLGKTDSIIETIKAEDLELVPIDKPGPPVPCLSYGLERVLFNPGVYHLRDPRSRVFNFDPYLQSIMPVDKFDFGALKKYITSSEDEALTSTATSQNKKYTGSTSSMTPTLGHFHYLLSQWRPINLSKLSKGFPEKLSSFTTLLRAPTAIFLRWKDGTYAIDADKEFDTANILMALGKSMEKLLTLPTADFEKYRKENSDQISEAQRNEPEAFHYSTIGDFLLRSQLDAYDPRLPGTGMFDLKTRAVLSIRMDTNNYQEGSGYEIRALHGRFESYEREYYDMMRSAFLKYSLQVRMGRMDGIFVAFHNTERIFGFQYISLSEMDEALHEQSDLTLGDAEFKLSLELLNVVLDRATKKFPKQSLRILFETREATSPFMYIFAEPITDDEIEAIQETKRDGIEKWEREVLGLDRDLELEDIQNEVKNEWESLQAKVEETMENDELGISERNDEPDDKDTLISEVKLYGSSMQESAEAVLPEPVIGRDSEDQESPQEINVGKEVENPKVRKVSSSEAAWKLGGKQETLPDHDYAEMEKEGGLELAKEKAEIYNDIVDACSCELSNAQGAVSDKRDHSSSSDRERSTKSELQDKMAPIRSKKGILAMTLTIRNKVNDKYAVRPMDLKATDKWSVEYAVTEIKKDRGRNLYKQAQMRRQRFYAKTNSDMYFRHTLHRISKAGRSWRKKQDKIDQAEPIKVLEDDVDADKELL